MTADSSGPDGIDLTVVCVTYHSADLAPSALRSALTASAAARMSTEVIVVDNASQDGTADAVAAAIPEVTLIRNTVNVGFGSANNQAFEVARGRWWLLLNPDATLDPDAVAHLIEAMTTDPRLAVVGPSVRGAGIGGAESAGMLPGIRSLAGHFLFINRLLPPGSGGPWRGFQVRPWKRSGLQEVEWVSAAAVLLRPEAVRQVGGFDAAIFLYGEDLDLCARLLQRGWRLALVPGAQATHAIGGSQAAGSTGWVDGIDQFLRRRGMTRFSRAVCFVCMAAGLAFRGLPWPGADSPRRRADSLRMRCSATRAMAIAVASAAGRNGPTRS